MHDLLSTLHTGMMWVLGFAIPITGIVLLAGMILKKPFGRLMAGIMSGLGWLMTAQWMIGISTLITRGEFDRWTFWSHAFTMTLAMALTHLSHRWKGAEDGVRYRRSLLIVIGVFMLVIVGVTLLFVG